ncbi:bifunctional phosphoglucose/phosphomannose isomerase [bacterium]|nr:MAG: bifunctional phosphoglucose/phosphomannose isomerase [bacterium]
MSMLDEVDFRARYDKDDCIGLIGRQLEQLASDLVQPVGLDPVRVKRVLVAGMGGSALASELARVLWRDRLPWPVDICKDYDLPAYVDDQTLVICSSYSGTSEETLAALTTARSAGAQVVCITAGGKLLATAQTEKLPFVALPSGIQGRYGVLSGLMAWAVVAQALGVKGLVDELQAAGRAVVEAAASWAPEVPAADNDAKKLAEALLGKPIILYAGPTMSAIAQKWKVDFNENAKHTAWWNVLPEMNHNELSGWGHPREHGLRVVELRSELDHEQVRKRFEVMNRLISDRWAPVEVYVVGKTAAEQTVWAFMLGSYVSGYLAILNQVEIATLPLVDKLKSQL